MSNYVGRIKDRDLSGLWVEFPRTSCNSCRNNCQQAQLIRLPEQTDICQAATHVEISMSSPNQLWLLFNSLMLPLIGFLLGATLANQLWLAEEWLTELITVVFSVLGMAIGIIACRTFSVQRLTINEVERC
ncbi:MAG: SoxR reducing system RseC family protein [bacterium]|nr:hypothetical protein [Gammaproteobacteria bacterium]HIL94682.1 hypothetical protein [Pseudomonadales bacterium]